MLPDVSCTRPSGINTKLRGREKVDFWVEEIIFEGVYDPFDEFVDTLGPNCRYYARDGWAQVGSRATENYTPFGCQPRFITMGIELAEELTETPTVNFRHADYN
jgi:hypothetical protein